MNDEIEKKQGRGKGCAVAAALLFLAALGFTFLALYLRSSLMNYQPAPDQPQEGDMVSVFAMMLLFTAAGVSLVAALYCLLVFYVRRSSRQKSSAE